MHLLSVLDAKNYIEELFELADKLKESKEELLKGKVLAMIFEKASTRTRVSFEVAMLSLGGHAIYMSPSEMQLARGESIKDTALTLSRYVDAVAIRAYKHETIKEFAKYASIPVINALSDFEHPVQIISDLYTIKKKKKSFNVKLAYVGDGNNVCNSLILGSAIVGMEIRVATPPGYEPDKKILKLAEKMNANVILTHEPEKAVREADIIYTDVWISMGHENEAEERLERFKKYKVDSKLVALADNPLIMHCLPAKRGLEITDEVMDSENSIVFEQAENRLHVQRAILYKLIRGEK